MSLRFIILTIVFTFTNIFRLLSQEDPKPLPPTLSYITVNSQTSNPKLKWKAPEPSISNPIPLGYIIYKRYVDQLGNNNLFEYANVNASTFEYEDTNTDASSAPVSYTVASIGPTEPSAQTVEHYTIFLSAKYDSCANQIDIQWTHYVGWGNDIKEYRILLGTIPNTINHTVVGRVDGTKNRFLHPIEPNQIYYLYVEAVKNGTEGFTSSSNMVELSTKMSRPPRYLYIDKIIGKENHNELDIRIDGDTEYQKFSIIRWPKADTVSVAKYAKTLYSFSDPNIELYTDTQDRWTTRAKPQFYRINAYDGCNRLKKTSSLTNSMVLRAYGHENKVHLTWSRYIRTHTSNSVRYRLFRYTYSPNQSTPQLLYNMLNSTDSTYTDDLTTFLGKGYEPKFCYYIEAIENVILEGRLIYSQSEPYCIDIAPEIVLPNAIDPLSSTIHNNIPRNIFAPLLTFEASYKLIIYSRNGGVVFLGTNTGWNGRMPKGDLAKEGTYIYRLEVTLPNGRSIIKTGSVTVIYGSN